MQNKRFLGLGFTFAAQDSGLEKKLVKIATLFDHINKTTSKMSSVNIGSASGSIGAGSVKSSSKSASRRVAKGSSGLTASMRAAASERKSPGSSEVPKYTKNYSQLKSISDSYTEALGKGVGAAYSKEAKRLIKEGMDYGAFAETITRRLKNVAEKTAESADTLGKKFSAVQRIFGYISGWIKGVGSSVNHFLETIGISLHEMVPKEFTAAVGVVKSLLSPIAHGATAGGKALMGSADKSSNNKILDRVTKISDSLGFSKSVPPVNKTLAKLLEVEEQKQGTEKNPFDKLKEFLKGIPFIGPLLSGIASILGKFGSALLTVGGWVLSAGKAIFNFGKTMLEWIGNLDDFKIIDMVADAFKFLFDTATSFGEVLMEVVVPVIALTAAAWGFASELGNIAQSIWGYFKSTFDLVMAGANYLFTWIETSTGPLASVLSAVVEGFKILGVAIKFIFQIFEVFGKNIGKLIGLTFDLGSALEQNATRSLNDSSKQMKVDSDKMSPADSMKSALANTDANADTADKTLSASEKTNDILQSMLGVLSTSNKSSVDINLRTKPREFEATINRNDTLNAAAQGTAAGNL